MSAYIMQINRNTILYQRWLMFQTPQALDYLKNKSEGREGQKVTVIC